MAFAETFKALSDPARRQILELLKEGPMSAGEIGTHFEMTGATMSYHLKILKKADLVFESRDKNFIYYQLNASVLEEILLWITSLRDEMKEEKTSGETDRVTTESRQAKEKEEKASGETDGITTEGRQAQEKEGKPKAGLPDRDQGAVDT